MTNATVERMTLEEVRKEIDEISGRMAEAFKQARNENGVIDTSKIEILEGDERSKSTQLVAMHESLTELGVRRDELVKLDGAADAADRERDWLDRPLGRAPVPTEGGDRPTPPKSFAQQVIESKAISEFNGRASPDVEIPVDVRSLLNPESKTVMSTGAGWAPESLRTPGSTLAGRETRYITDFIPIVPTTQAAYVFMRQTTRTNNAQEDAESVDGTLDSAAESAFAYTEVSETLRKIRHFLPVTTEQIADVPGLEAELDAEMIAGCRERLSSQIVAGNGTAPNIEGFLDAGRTSVNSVAKGANDVFTAIHDGMRENEVVGFAEVDLIVLHPTDWHGIRTTQTADGVFILGPPSLADAKMLWGVPVLTTTHETENTALMGAFARFARVPVIGDVTVRVSDSHASYFIQGVLAIVAELRATLAVLREDAFTKVTDI